MKIQTENNNLLRDVHSKALLNRNIQELALNNQRRALLLNKEQRIENLEKDMSEIKSLLIEMIKSNVN